MKKNYVLDTNVLLHDPDALVAFDDNHVVVPITVIEEIDRFKKNADEVGRNARQTSRMLDQFRGEGDLRAGVDNGLGGTVRVVIGHQGKLPPELPKDKEDHRILAVCLGLQEQEPDRPVVFVTKDTNLRIKADAVGVKAVDYERGTVRLDEAYTGAVELKVSGEEVDRLHQEGRVALDAELWDNQFVNLVNAANPGHAGLGRYVRREGVVRRLRPIKGTIWGIGPRNREQSYALDALLDEEVKLVTLVGKAGTGKTLLAMAAGLQKTVEEQVFSRLLVSRPVFPMGRDIGFLPGDLQEKLRPWMQPIFDNVDLLLSGGVEGRDGKRNRGAQELMDLELMAIEPLTYIRGRSIPNQYLVVDEAQNLTPHEIKTIITRAGEGTKVVLTGDPHQIDHPYVDATSNGLSYCVDRFKGQHVAAHITLNKGERSELAELAANLL